MDFHFNNQVAKDFDISIATILQNIKFWTLTNLANKRNIHDGLCWTYNSVDAFCEIFEFWTRHQIEHLFKKCVNEGLLQVGNYNTTKYDRTKWYALTPKAYQYYPELLKENFVKTMYESISENSEIMFGEFRNQFLKFPEPIPDSNPVKKPDINNSESNDSPSPNPKHKIKDIQPYIDIWNELTEHTGNPKQGIEKRSLQEIKRNLNTINEHWQIPLTPGNFRAWLSKAINCEFYFLTEVRFLKSMKVCTRWDHFEESLTYIKNKERMNER